MFRLNRMKPQGRSAAMNARSSALSAVPDMPVMNALRFMRRGLAAQRHGGQQGPTLISLDDALAAGGLEAAAELRRFVRRAKRTDHGPVVDALVAEIGALDDRRARAEHRRELALQRLERRLRVGFALLRGYLHEE